MTDSTLHAPLRWTKSEAPLLMFATRWSNLWLKSELAVAQARIRELENLQRTWSPSLPSLELSPDASSQELLFAFQSEIHTVNDRLLALQTELSIREKRIQELEEELDSTSAELTTLRLFPGPVEVEPPRSEPAVGSAQQGWDALSPSHQALIKTVEQDVAEGRFQEAESRLFELLESYPENDYVLARLAAAKLHSGKVRSAEIAVNRALEVHPANAFALSTLGMVQFRTGRAEEAEATLRRSLELNPAEPRTLNYLGIVTSQTLGIQEAEAYFNQALAIDSDYSEAHFNLAIMYATQNPPMLEQARRHYFSATSLGGQPDLALEQLLQ